VLNSCLLQTLHATFFLSFSFLLSVEDQLDLIILKGWSEKAWGPCFHTGKLRLQPSVSIIEMIGLPSFIRLLNERRVNPKLIFPKGLLVWLVFEHPWVLFFSLLFVCSSWGLHYFADFNFQLLGHLMVFGSCKLWFFELFVCWCSSRLEWVLGIRRFSLLLSFLLLKAITCVDYGII